MKQQDLHGDSFKSKNVAITGAAGDIGLATARHLGSLGATPVLLDIDGEKLAKAEASLKADGISPVSKICDVTEEEQVSRTIAEIYDEAGPVTYLLNNAGYQGQFATVHEYPTDDFERVMQINVQGAFVVLKVVSAHMVQMGGGAIVNTASMAAVGGPPNMIAYATSKAAIIGMTQTASTDLAPYGIRVNAISPAYMGPGFMWERQVELQAAVGSQYFSTEPEVVAQEMIGSVPMRRYGRIDEIPGTVAYLLSENASYISGINIPIAGGII